MTMNEETVSLLEAKLREEERIREESAKRLSSAKSEVLTYASKIAESERIIHDLKSILGRSNGAH